MLTLSLLQWGGALIAAFLIGISKTGVPGSGILVVALFASLFPARLSTGIVLPLLIVGDFLAVGMYRRKANWPHLFRLFPAAAVGVVLGYLTLDHLNSRQVEWTIGGLLLALIALHFIRQRFPEWVPHAAGAAFFTGIFAGFSTMVANAAGPIMILYFLEMKFKKEEFLGTSAWYFLILNLFKVPFGIDLGIITPDSFHLNLCLAPAVIIGGLLGGWIAKKLSQKLFEIIALVFTGLAALRLIW